jgi:hypothetical protein
MPFFNPNLPSRGARFRHGLIIAGAIKGREQVPTEMLIASKAASFLFDITASQEKVIHQL